MAVRKLAWGLLVVALVGGQAVRAGASAPTSQSSSGSASGSYSVAFLPDETHFDGGEYHSLSQLGNGQYRFVTTATACVLDTNQRLTGTATLTRSDGALLRGTVSGLKDCSSGSSGAIVFSLDLTTGTRDLAGAHLQLSGSAHFDHITPGGSVGTESLAISGPVTVSTRLGWWTLGQSGSVYAFGGAPYLGRAVAPAGAPAIALAATPVRDGYWVVGSTGQVYAFGRAHWAGNANRSSWSPSERVVSIASTASGLGYWLFTSAGRVVPFGDAPLLGEFAPRALAAPIVAAMATSTHLGYWLVGSDGGVFAYGDARFHGSTGALRLNRPIVGAAASPDGAGYWLVAADGGVFSFDVPFRGSLGARPPADPIVGASAYGNGYVLTSNAGDAFDFSTAPFFGWAATNTLTLPPIAGITALG